MPNPFSPIKDQFDQWGAALRKHIMIDVLSLLVDILEAKPTTVEVLRSKIEDLKNQ